MNIDITLHLSPEFEKLLLELGKQNLAAIGKMESNAMAALDDLKRSFAAYAAKVEAYVAAAEAHKASVDQQIADAIAKDDADEEVDLAQLKADIEASAEKVPEPPETPPEAVPPEGTTV